MPRNGSGTFIRDNSVTTGAEVWETQASTTRVIDSDDHDYHDQDIANALTASIANDGQTPILANLPMSGFKHTNVGTATARTQYATLGQMQDGGPAFGGSAGGTANAITITLSPAISAYATGQRFFFLATADNTSATTINVNSVGAKTIKKADGATDLAAKDITSGQVVDIVYDGTNFRLLPPQGLNTTSSPSFAGLTLSGLTASRPLALDASKVLTSPTAADFRTSFGIAASGANSDITALTGVTLTTWSPTIAASGSMTVSSTTIDDARYQRLGGFIYFNFAARFTLGGTASNYIKVPPPVAGVAHDSNCAFVCAADENSTGVAIPRWRYDGTDLIVFKAGLSNFTLGANAAVNIMGFYRAV